MLLFSTSVSGGQCCCFRPAFTGSINGIDPHLGALQDNGGYTWTQAIFANSVASQKIPLADCPSVDQRGEARPQPSSSSFCDIGAYEYSPPVSISFVSDPISGPTSAGANLGPVQIGAFDAAGLPAVSNHIINLNLSTPTPTSDFAETQLGVKGPVAVIPSGQTTGSFYFGNYHPNSVPITVHGTVGNVNLGSVSQTETVYTGPAATVSTTAGDGQSVAVGNPFSTLSVNVVDGTNNPVNNEPVTFTIASGPATFASGTTATVSTDVNGDASAPILTAGHTPGGVVIDVTTSQAGVTTSFNETVVVGPPTTLTVLNGNDQTASPLNDFGTNLSTTLVDEYGNPISGQTIVYNVSNGTANFSSSHTNNQVTDASGNTTADDLTAGTVAGTQTITASVQSAPAVTASFSDVIIVPGPAYTISVATGNSQTTTSDTTFYTPLSATVTDQWGNVRFDDQVDFAVTSGSAHFASGTTDSQDTDATGVATDTLIAGDHAGTEGVTATVDGTAVTTSFTGITITAPTLTSTVRSFAINSAQLTATMKTQINALASTIKRFGQTNVALVGYSDITGTSGENQPLSLNRAKAVRTYLASRLTSIGVSGVSITVSGKGATNFVGGNGHTALNRRVSATLS